MTNKHHAHTQLLLTPGFESESWRLHIAEIAKASNGRGQNQYCLEILVEFPGLEQLFEEMLKTVHHIR